MEARADALPELAAVYWRPRASDRTLRRAERLWTLTAAAHTVPFIAVAALLVALKPITAPVALMALAHAWIIPELYAARGAGVVRPRAASDPEPEQVAAGLLGDLVDHRARDLHARTGLVIEVGKLGIWLVGEAGALLVRPGGRRVHCYCVRAKEDDLPSGGRSAHVPSGDRIPRLPSGDRIAHLLLALRTDEPGFATVANLAFAGATWRLRRRLATPAREALGVATARARGLADNGD